MDQTRKSSAVVPAAVPPQYEDILTIAQVVPILQLEESQIYELTRRRNARPLPMHKAGKFLRFRRSEIERWLDGENVLIKKS